LRGLALSAVRVWHNLCVWSIRGGLSAPEPERGVLMNDRTNNLQELWDNVKDVRIAMLVTHGPAGLQSRPMFTQEVDFSEGIWFFTDRNSEKVTNIGRNSQVNLAYADPDSSLYVSVSGTARVVDDRARARELWNPANKVFFPDGVDDPDLVLIEIDPQSAEVWDSPAGKVRQLFSAVKTAITGEPEDLGEHRTYKL